MICIKVFIMPFYKIFKVLGRLFGPVKKLAQNTRKKAFNFVKNNVEKIRNAFPVMKDRREDLYAKL